MSNKSKKHGSGLGCDVHRYIMTSITGQTPDSLGWWEGTLNDFCYQIQANQRHTRASSPHTKPGFVLRQGWCLLCNMYRVFKRKPFESGPHKRDLNTQK